MVVEQIPRKKIGNHPTRDNDNTSSNVKFDNKGIKNKSPKNWAKPVRMTGSNSLNSFFPTTVYMAADKGAGRITRACNGSLVICKLGINTIAKPRKEIIIPAILIEVILSFRIILENKAMNEGTVAMTKLASPDEV
jgi:hypothetical protein